MCQRIIYTFLIQLWIQAGLGHLRDQSSSTWSLISHGDFPISPNSANSAHNELKSLCGLLKAKSSLFHTCSIHATRTLISHGQGSCCITSIQYLIMIYLSDRVRLIRLSIHRYKQSVRYLQTMLKRYMQHNYFQKQLNILAPIYKQTRYFLHFFVQETLYNKVLR